MDKLYTQDLFNISPVQIFIRETPLTEQNLIKYRLIQQTEFLTHVKNGILDELTIRKRKRYVS